MLRVRVLACLLVAGFAVACRSPTSPEKSLEAHIRDYVGSGAIDCGRLTRTAADQEMQAALNCALDAAGRNVAFSVVRPYQGTDSSFAEGLMAKAGGATVKFFYDSAPCGGPNCGESFTTQSCAAPHLSTQSGRTVFACGAPEHP